MDFEGILLYFKQKSVCKENVRLLDGQEENKFLVGSKLAVFMNSTSGGKTHECLCTAYYQRSVLNFDRVTISTKN